MTAAGTLSISLNRREGECIACGAAVTDPRQGLPMRDGEIVDLEDNGEWGGFHACRDCYNAYIVAGPAGVRIRLQAIAGAADRFEVVGPDGQVEWDSEAAYRNSPEMSSAERAAVAVKIATVGVGGIGRDVRRSIVIRSSLHLSR